MYQHPSSSNAFVSVQISSEQQRENPRREKRHEKEKKEEDNIPNSSNI
jgi:hypothetical protein